MKWVRIESKNKLLHTYIWLQPPFFSILVSHLGHSLVLVIIQLAVWSSILWALFPTQSLVHLRSKWYSMGSWFDCPHPKHICVPQTHRTSCAPLTSTLKAWSQSALVHHRSKRMLSTNEFVVNLWYFNLTDASLNSWRTCSSSTITLHFVSAQVME